jgi:uncharacterized membrane protein
MYNSVFVGAMLCAIFAFLILEITGFILETFFKIKAFPTLSTLLVGWFGVKPLVIATIVIGIALAWHWSWVSDNMGAFVRALGR